MQKNDNQAGWLGKGKKRKAQLLMKKTFFTGREGIVGRCRGLQK